MRFGVIGCGYVGMDTAIRLKYANHHVIGTTRPKQGLESWWRFCIAPTFLTSLKPTWI